MSIVDYREFRWEVSFSAVIILCLTENGFTTKTGHCLPWSQKFQVPVDIFSCSLCNYLYEQYFEKAEAVHLWPAWLKHVQWCCTMEAFSAWHWLLDAVHIGLLREGSFPLLYLAGTALLWVASVLSLEQRKYSNTCQELNFIFKSCFLQNRIYLWPSLVTADPHMGIDVGWVTWVSFSNRYISRTVLKGHHFILRALTFSQPLSPGSCFCFYHHI